MDFLNNVTLKDWLHRFPFHVHQLVWCFFLLLQTYYVSLPTSKIRICFINNKNTAFYSKRMNYELLTDWKRKGCLIQLYFEQSCGESHTHRTSFDKWNWVFWKERNRKIEGTLCQTINKRGKLLEVHMETTSQALLPGNT